MSLLDVSRFVVSTSAIDATDDALREAGANGCELFVLWSGTKEGADFVVRAVHVPPQQAYQLPDGLLVRVDGDALHILNTWLFEHHQQLGVQIHAHPTNAFHSETDDTYPIVTAHGGLSIVAANFARAGLLASDSAAYRLIDGEWVALTAQQIAATLEVL